MVMTVTIKTGGFEVAGRARVAVLQVDHRFPLIDQMLIDHLIAATKTIAAGLAARLRIRSGGIAWNAADF